jgi:hypothetical protein
MKLKIMIAFSFLLFSTTSHAVTFFAGKIAAVMTQSPAHSGGSSAHLVRFKEIDGPELHCNGGLYIDFADKALYAIALTAMTLDKRIGVAYDEDAPNKYIPPHQESTCQIYSIWDN